jgi:chromosome segregation ATPase
MTKQEYVDKFNAAWFSGARCGKLKAVTEIKDEYIASLEAENTNLKTEIAQLKKDKLEFNAQCFHKDETISILKNRITELESDNRYLVEQINQMVHIGTN